MLNLPALLLDAADKATAAQARALAALEAPVAWPTEEQIATALATLPAWAAQAMTENPHAGLVEFLTAKTRDEARLLEVVKQVLVNNGVHAVLTHDTSRVPVLATALRISLPSLVTAATKLREQAALDAFTLAWQALAGDTAPVTRNPSAGTLLVGTSTLGSGGLGGDLYTLSPGWQTRPTADLVEEARVALRLPRWTLDGLAVAWGDTAKRLSLTAPAAVDLVHGYHRGAVYKPVQAVALHGCDAAPIHLDLADVLDLTADEVVARAVLSANLDLSAAPPTAPVESMPSAPPAQHLSRGERRRLAQRAAV